MTTLYYSLFWRLLRIHWLILVFRDFIFQSHIRVLILHMRKQSKTEEYIKRWLKEYQRIYFESRIKVYFVRGWLNKFSKESPNVHVQSSICYFERMSFGRWKWILFNIFDKNKSFFSMGLFGQRRYLINT